MNIIDMRKLNPVEGNYIINGTVHVKNGIIKDNPFSKKLGNCDAAKWILQNKSKAKNKIREIMKEQSLGFHEVDECFGFAVYFFLERDDREFNPEYFGDSGSKTYNIEIYCLFKLKMIVYEYRNEMRKRLQKTVYLVDSDKDENDNLPKGCLSYNVLKREQDSNFENYNFNDIIEFEDLQDVFDVELSNFNESFKQLGLLNFNFKNYVYFMFLCEETKSYENTYSDDGEVDLNLVSDKLGITTSALTKINKIMKNLVKTRPDLFGEIPDILNRLIQGKNSGWYPKYNYIN